jgi:putative redox protein
MIEAKTIWIDGHRFVGQAGSSHGVVVDGDSKTGGSPMELVLIALCGCTGYDVASILTKKREPFTGLEVRAEAEKAPTSPSVFKRIKLVYSVRGQVSRKSAEDAIQLSKDKYCSVSAMLEKTAEISWELELSTS